MTRTALAVTLVCLTAGCDTGSPVRAAEASSAASIVTTDGDRARRDSALRATPGYVIDSILPADEEIGRFQASIGPNPERFTGGATSRAALVAAFVQAVEQNDTTSLASFLVDRAEFGYLIYPTSPNASPPYQQSPDIVWLTRSAATTKGAARLLERFGGKPLGYVGFSCGAPDRQGRNVVWNDCTLKRIGARGDTTRHRLFGPIAERDGRFKILSLSNGL